MRRLGTAQKCLVLSGVAGAALALGAPATAFGDVLTPESPHSPNAADIRDAYVIVGVIVVLVSIAAIAAMLLALRRFRSDSASERRSERSGPRVQTYATAGLAALATAIFVIGAVYTESAREIEPTGPEGLTGTSPLEVQVSGQQFLWRYEYPDQLKADDAGPSLFAYHELVVPVDTAVKLNVISVDVQHRWSVPALGPMATAVPGEVNETWFKADEVGVYEGRSAEFAGPATVAMRARVRVVSADEFSTWTEQQQADIAEAQAAVASAVNGGEAGEEVTG